MADSTGVIWHRVGKEHGRAVLSGGKAPAPGKGVWVAALETRDGGQYSYEAIAVDGKVAYMRNCYCGQDRNIAWLMAEDFLFRRKAIPETAEGG